MENKKEGKTKEKSLFLSRSIHSLTHSFVHSISYSANILPVQSVSQWVLAVVPQFRPFTVVQLSMTRLNNHHQISSFGSNACQMLVSVGHRVVRFLVHVPYGSIRWKPLLLTDEWVERKKEEDGFANSGGRGTGMGSDQGTSETHRFDHIGTDWPTFEIFQIGIQNYIITHDWLLNLAFQAT